MGEYLSQLPPRIPESIYRRYAIVAERDLAEGVAKLATLRSNPSEGRKVLQFPTSETVGRQSAVSGT
jgi:hypothetical protein